MNLFIFRRDLRIEDNTALNLAFKAGNVIPIFIFDQKQVKDNEFKSDNAVQFMISSLKELEEDIKAKGGNLNFFYGDTLEVLEEILTKEKINSLFFNLDYTPFAKERDKKIFDVCKSNNVQVKAVEDALINPVEKVLNKGKPYKVFTPYYNKAKEVEVKKPFTEKQIFYKKSINNQFSFNLEDSKAFFEFNEYLAVKGGRKEALEILERSFANYSNIRNIPSLSTSKLSAHLKFGTISVREALDKIKNEELSRQIYWRDFWAYIMHFYPKVLKENFYDKFNNIPWKKEHFEAWKKGDTGFPIIDAGMRELNKTGYMHNRLRMLTASFLTKNLLVDWRLGAKYFAQKLVDYCPMQNQNNWQSTAGTGASALAWFRVMNPWLQQEKFDPDCKYIKKWVEELKYMNVKDIHKWNEVWMRYDVYTKPIVEHKDTSKEFIESLKKSFVE